MEENSILKYLEEDRKRGLQNIDEDFKQEELPYSKKAWFLSDLKDKIVRIPGDYDETSALICPVEPRTYFQLKRVIFTLELLARTERKTPLFWFASYNRVTAIANKILINTRYKVPTHLFVRTTCRLDDGHVEPSIHYSTPEKELTELQYGIDHLKANQEIIHSTLMKCKKED